MTSSNVDNRQNINILQYFIVIICLCGCSPKESAATLDKGVASNVDTYPAPTEIAKATDYTVSVDGNNSFVYDMLPAVIENTALIPSMPFTYFGFSGSVTVTVSKSTSFSNVVIRPLNNGIKYTKNGNSITFNLDVPQNLVLEFDGDLKRPLMIFANPKETNVPGKNDYNVVYWDKGITDVGKEYVLQSNKTYYVAGGAIVKGSFITAPGSSNVKIEGPGILLNNDPTPHHQLNANKTTNLSISNTIFANPSKTWAIMIYDGSLNVNLNNVKILSSIKDGLDLNGVGHAFVDKCFIMSCDDAVALKATNITTYGNNDITVQNCTINQLGGGNSLEIGFEGNTGTMTGLTFKNIDIIHSFLGKTPPPMQYEADWNSDGVITMHVNNGVNITNVLYDNIRIEDSDEDFLIALRIWKGPYYNIPPYDNKLGQIDGVQFRHIYFSNANPVFGKSKGIYNLIKGFDGTSMVKNVSFSDLVINGTPVTDYSSGKFDINGFTSNITFTK